MRALTRTLVSVATAAGIAAGTLATAGTNFAANATAIEPTASTEAVAPWADNLSLSTGQAKKVQQWLKEKWGYNGPINGQLDRTKNWGYGDAVDGIIGEKLKAAFRRFADSL